MSAPEWKVGDRALLPVVVVNVTHDGYIVNTASGRDVDDWIDGVDLIPDDRRPSWLPGQPGDVAEFTAQSANEYGDTVIASRWMRGVHGWWAPGMGGNWIEDDAVPADAVLVLPAKTWEA